MVINEVFPNPTVKHVIFQIRYPNLFIIENKIGDFQIKIMDRFPNSALKIKQKGFILDAGAEIIYKEKPENQKELGGEKAWSFSSPDEKVVLNVSSNSLDISSNFHKTYNNAKKSKDNFRDTIEFVLDQFFQLTKIPIIKRIGLRYVDECPIFKRVNSNFKSYYNTTFDLKRFPIKDSEEMIFKVVFKKGNYFLIFHEVVKKDKLFLDFDAFANGINSSDYLKVNDDLHLIISEEFEKSIKEPVYDYMRKKKEVENDS